MKTSKILSILVLSLVFLNTNAAKAQDTVNAAKTRNADELSETFDRDTAMGAMSCKQFEQINAYVQDTVFNPDSRLQNRRSNAVRDKRKNPKIEKSLLFSFSFGPATTRMDTLKDFDYLTFQASVGFCSQSTIFPITLSYTQTTNLTDFGTTYQRDLHLGTFAGILGSEKVCILGGLGLGVSFGTIYEKSNSTGSVKEESFVLPSAVLDGEIMLTLNKYAALGVKGNMSINKKRKLVSFMLSTIVFNPL